MSLEPVLPFALRLVCGTYLALALGVMLAQAYYAYRNRPPCPVRQERARRMWPSVDVLVPCFNEDPALLDAALASLALQDYLGPLQVFVVDDGSRNREDVRPVLDRHAARPGWHVLLLSHGGKRRALDAALRSGEGAVVVTVDSDTVVLPDGISQMVAALEDPRVGVVSSNLRVMNASANLLTRLINQNYWLLFEQKRLAQSHLRTVLCCWGGFAAYRRSVLEQVWAGHLSETVAGRRCTSGDDLHLTLQILARGYDAVAQPAARALTYVPETLRQYARQQIRWSRSFIRELPLAVRVVRARHPYLRFELAVQALTPLLLAAAMLLTLAEGVLLGPGRLATDALLVGVTLSSVVEAAQARNLLYVLYGPVYLALVLPGWLRALVTPARDTWKSRDLSL